MKEVDPMNHEEKRRYLIDALLSEQPRYRNMAIPSDETEQRQLLRGRRNVRMPGAVDEEVLRVQDDYLREAITERGITEIDSLTPVEPGIYLWQGDITTLRCDAIVNAANSGMTGCYQPCHSCIDNRIHTYAGMQLRNVCAEIMAAQGHEEPTGQAKITPGFNLPCRYVIHTVGPIVDGRLTKRHEAQLASCYRACLSLAEENGCGSIAFCCISTGVFGFPKEEAAEIAIRTVRDWKAETGSGMRVVFNVYSDRSLDLYKRKLNL